MVVNPLQQVKALGQSVWLDYIQRDILENGEVARMIEKDGLAGMTSNPTGIKVRQRSLSLQQRRLCR